MTDQTPVIFRADKGGEVIAFLPSLPGDSNPYRTCLSYVHMGQHGAASLEYYYSTRPAQPHEYAALLEELQRIYDGKLKPVTRMTKSDLESRKELAR